MSKNDKKNSLYHVVPMTIDDINRVREQFVTAAINAQTAGAQLIQLQAANGYLLSSFLSPYTNKRNDAYGGNAERRMRFLIEIINAIKLTCPRLDISVRLGVDDCLPDGKGQRPELIASYMYMLEEAGVAFISCSMSIGETFDIMLSYSQKSYERLCNGIKIVCIKTNIPLGFSGFIGSLQ